MTYANLEQRVAQDFIDMLPPFVPDEKAPVSIREQERFYCLMKNLYQLAFDEPLLFVVSLHEDDAFPNRFNKASYNKPKLLTDMKKFAKSIESLLKNLFFLGQGGDVTFSKRQQAVLSRLGLDDFADLPPALVWMTTRTDANIATFSHCFFCKDYPYTTDIFARLLGESAFRKLVNWMLANGYERFDIYNVTASDCKVSLTIADPKWSSAPPNGGFEYKIKHTGISARLDPYVETPPVFGLCIPNGLKTYLEAFDVMNIELRRFVMRHTKQCDGCKFCVQTDKTGSRPLAYVTVGFENKNYRFCTYFPGYNYCWTQIDDALAENLMQMLAFMDTFASREKGGG